MEIVALFLPYPDAIVAGLERCFDLAFQLVSFSGVSGRHQPPHFRQRVVELPSRRFPCYLVVSGTERPPFISTAITLRLGLKLSALLRRKALLLGGDEVAQEMVKGTMRPPSISNAITQCLGLKLSMLLRLDALRLGAAEVAQEKIQSSLSTEFNNYDDVL